MLLRELICLGEDTVSRLYPEREARNMVFSLLEHVLGTKRHTHIVEPGYEVSPEKCRIVLDAFHRLGAGEPLQYVTGQAWFYGRPFKVTPDVLIPRPETELLCRTALEYASLMEQSPNVLDLCTGSGCIAWTVALELPASTVYAADISEAALEVASSQDFPSGPAPVFFQADVLSDGLPGKIRDSLPGAPSEFDMILSNPPYVKDSEKAFMRSNVLDHEPSLALFVPDDNPLLFYKALAAHASALLKEDGFGLVEINESLGQETASVFAQAGFSRTEILPDFSSRPRFVLFRR
ncbi:MAG: peptide chain release factor N(5)-glutamine methyltransferase [Candidatus Cryptobacteroides sp.]